MVNRFFIIENTEIFDLNEIFAKNFDLEGTMPNVDSNITVNETLNFFSYKFYHTLHIYLINTLFNGDAFLNDNNVAKF